MVALLLPLSSLWASMAIDQEASALDLSNLSGSSSVRRGSNQHQMCSSQFSASTAPSSRLEFANDRKGSFAPISPTSIDSRVEHGPSRDSTELDIEALGVRVDKSYSVQSRKDSAGN
jgi:pheromone alpha factor receptor